MTIGVRKVHEEAAARCVVGREGESEQSAFAARPDRRPQIQKVRRQGCTSPHRANTARLLDNELDERVRRILHDSNGQIEPGCVDTSAKARLRVTGAVKRQQRERGRHSDLTHAGMVNQLPLIDTLDAERPEVAQLGQAGRYSKLNAAFSWPIIR